MNNYMNFNNFRKDVEAALTDVAKKYGVEVEAGKITYTDTSLTMQLKVQRSDIDVQKTQFENNIQYMHGFSKEDYLRTFKDGRKTYTITGFKPFNKYDVICMDEAGREYSFRSSAVLKALDAATIK